MKNKYYKNLSINAFLFLLISLFSLGFITSSNKSSEIVKKESLIEVVNKTAAESTTAVLEKAKEEIVVEKQPEEIKEEAPVVEKKEEKTNNNQTTTKKKSTTKKSTTTKKAKETTTTTNTIKKDKYGNEVGSISISGSNFKKDLVSDDGSYYYLDHTLAGKLNNRGVPFIDYRNDFTGRKTIIYSHSAKDGSAPFNYLQNYNGNQSFYNSHKYIYINYGGKEYTYLIFSAYISVANDDYDDGLEYYRVMNYSDSEWAQKIQEYKNNSDYDTGVEVSANDKILILQTCSMDSRYYKKYYRYNQLVMAKLISVK